MTRLIALFVVLITGGFAVSANAAVFNVGWQGGGGYSLTGKLTFSDTLLNTGSIDETDIDNLMIDVLLNGVSQGTWNSDDGEGDGALPFNLNFDTNTNEFIVGGGSDGTSGQQWNAFANIGFGFFSDIVTQGITQNGVTIPQSQVLTARSTLTATVVPVPAALPLLATGLVVLGAVSYRRKQRQ